MSIKTVLTTLIWALTFSAITLQVLYASPSLQWYHYVLLVIVSLLCGITIVDLKDMIISYFIFIPASLFLMTFFLAVLPAITGKLQYGLFSLDLVVSSALGMVMRTTFPGLWVLCLLAAILGVGIGERIDKPEEADIGFN